MILKAWPFSRAILTKILTGCQESARLYGTQLLRAFVRVGAEEFSQWGVELLVGQLYDESNIVSLAALDVLDEACDNEVSECDNEMSECDNELNECDNEVSECDNEVSECDNEVSVWQWGEWVW